MGDDNSLGLTGRTRCINDIGRVIGPERANCLPVCGIIDRTVFQCLDKFGRIGQEGVRGLRQARRNIGGSDQISRLGIRKHKGYPLGRIIRVDRQIGGPGLEDCQQRDNHLRRAWHSQGHDILRSDPLLDQQVSQAVGALVHLAVAQLLFLPDQGHCFRGPFHLGFKQLRESGLGNRARRLVPLQNNPSPLLFSQQIDARERRLRISQQRLQQPQVMPGHLLYPPAVEQVAVVEPGESEFSIPLPGVQLQVTADAQLIARQRLDLQPLHCLRDLWGILQGEDYLEEGRGVEAALRGEFLDQPLEGQILMLVSLQRRLPDLGEQLGEAEPGVEAQAHDQRVDEKADQLLQLCLLSVGDGRADEDLILVAVAGEQDSEGGQQGHIEGGLVAPAELLQAGQQLRVELELAEFGGKGLEWWTSSVGGQLEPLGNGGQLLLPVGQSGAQRLLLLALPQGKVGILDRQWRERMMLALAESLVEDGQLAGEDGLRPAIGDDVVKSAQEDMLLGRELEELEAEQRSAGQVEGLGGLAAQLGADARLSLSLIEFTEIIQREIDEQLLGDDLEGFAVLLGEVSAEALVPSDDRIDGGLKGGAVERSAETEGGGHVVLGAGFTQAVDEPEALLGIGEGEAIRARKRSNAQNICATGVFTPESLLKKQLLAL